MAQPLFDTRLVEPEKPWQVTISTVRTFDTCKRKFYWRYVRSIGGSYLHLPFYVGTFVHEGIEMFYKGRDIEDILETISTKIQEKSAQYNIRPEDVPKKEQMDSVILAALEAYIKQKKRSKEKWITESAEKAYRMALPGLKLKFRGALDLVVKRKRKNGDKVRTIVDHKVLAMISHTLNEGIFQNAQIQLYPLLYKACTGLKIYDGYFNVIMKPKIRQRMADTRDDYLDRLRALYIDKEEEMFWRKHHIFEERHVQEAYNNFLMSVEQIEQILEDAGDDYHDAQKWQKNTERCFDYFTECPYFKLCRFGEAPENALFLDRAVEYISGQVIDEPEIEAKKQKAFARWRKVKPEHEPRI